MKTFFTYCVVFLTIIFLQTAAAFSVEHKDAALYMLRMINNARTLPENAVQEIGMQKSQVQANLGTGAWVLDQGVAPLAWNDKLAASALAHAKDMITNLYYAYDSLNGATVQARIAATGYNFVYSGESLGILSFNKYITHLQAAEIIFKNMLAYELGDSISAVNRNMLDENKTEIGVAFLSAVADLGLDVPVNIYLVVADFAMPVEPRSFVIGNVYEKNSASQTFAITNSVADQYLILKGLSEGTTEARLSDVTGFFQFALPFGFSVLEAWNETHNALLARYGIFGQSQNILLDVFVDK